MLPLLLFYCALIVYAAYLYFFVTRTNDTPEKTKETRRELPLKDAALLSARLRLRRPAIGTDGRVLAYSLLAYSCWAGGAAMMARYLLVCEGAGHV